ncbi:hypothetical protein N7471_000926 [Penicillium samsonianum]|uniref:uncharacterized protein n=1 Tax=Penicillium samsonianum TaxID=1882272 RepID=UPI002547308F|nr:uncharacterized protein N7471_000926 [Penicillium samsonianum]KAJ6149727.1 hypothetical protein N7471_000926 [Penicillium samsonianum]
MSKTALPAQAAQLCAVEATFSNYPHREEASYRVTCFNASLTREGPGANVIIPGLRFCRNDFRYPQHPGVGPYATHSRTR